jgi:valyl-tRNA synthetase
MDKQWDHKEFESKIYQQWEKKGYFTPEIDPKKEPFTILLPPPNANDPLHAGHAMYVIEDILCRWHRMIGDPTLFLPGFDHAGIETQFVFEKKLQEKGKSRFDYDRDTLYQMISDYVQKNKGIAKKQLKQLGFSLDWTREKFTLDKKLLKTVVNTFKKLHDDGLLYRDSRIVNYCTECGTAFSDLEVNYVERDDFLYYLNYGPIEIATTRPETIFADSAVAVNPNDKRYKKLIGNKAIIPLIDKEIPIISDELVETDFGTGALKITPAHDQTDYIIGEKHNLERISSINREGKTINVPDKYSGMNVAEARKKVVADLEKSSKLIKKEKLTHSIGTCYRCGTTIEPMLMPQWYVKIKPLAEKAIKAVKNKKVKIVPKRFEKQYFRWMENIRDWNISRQIVWGPRIPAWYCLDCSPEIIIEFIDKDGQQIQDKYKNLKDKYDFMEIKNGLQNLTAPVDAAYLVDQYEVCPNCQSQHILQETDTFDTWFSSGQWPLTTLGYPDSKDFNYFYPTSVLDTMWDILFFWVARMIMLGLYLADEVPFKIAHMHSRVMDAEGRKMSKSKGNVIDPIKIAEEYGADSLRMALIYGTAPASDIALSEDKIRAMRNFGNKFWNAARFVKMNLKAEGKTAKENLTQGKTSEVSNDLTSQVGELGKVEELAEEDQAIMKKLNNTVKSVNQQMEKFRFGQALEDIYQFFWHEYCDIYLEECKDRREEALPTLIHVLITSLKLLHPYAPFVTETIYQEFKQELPDHPLLKPDMLIIAPWPVYTLEENQK